MKLGEFYLIILLTGLSTTTVADEIVHGFKNPSFSGIGSSAHYLTVENQEKSRRDEIQDDINEYVEHKEDTEKQGLGFVEKEDEKELKVNVSKNEIDKLIKEYKKIKKNQKSNFSQIKKMGLVDKHGKPLK